MNEESTPEETVEEVAAEETVTEAPPEKVRPKARAKKPAPRRFVYIGRGGVNIDGIAFSRGIEVEVDNPATQKKLTEHGKFVEV